MKKRVRTKSWIAAVVIGIVLACVLFPLMRRGFFLSDDGEWMVIRLSAFYQSLASGQFPVRYLGRLNFSYGYPVANFLYPGFLYIGTLLSLVGFPFTAAVKLILIGSVIGGTALTYRMLRKRYPGVPAIFGTVSFAGAPYLLYDLYVRGSVGEVIGMFAAILTVYAVTSGSVLLVAPAVAFLLVSHNTVALIAGSFIALLIVTRPDRLKLAVSALLGVGMAAFFWIPAIAEKSLVRFDATEVSDPTRYFITPETFPLLGLAALLSLLLVVGIRRSARGLWVFTAATAVGILLALPVSAPVWKVGAFARLVQFPYRFLILPVLFAPWLTAAVTEHLVGWRRKAFLILCGILLIAGSVPILRSVRYVDREEGYYTTNEGTTTVRNEYMPRWVAVPPDTRPVDTIEILDGDADLSSRRFNGERLTFTVNARETSLLQINKVWYPGWGITVDNVLTPVNYVNRHGVMRIEIPAGTHTVRAAFRETPFRFAADLLSVVSAVAYLLLAVRRRHT